MKQKTSELTEVIMLMVEHLENNLHLIFEETRDEVSEEEIIP